MKFIFKDRDCKETYNGWKYPPETSPVEFSSLEEFTAWSKDVGLPRFEFVPPGGRSGDGFPHTNKSPHWMVYCMSSYD